MWQRHFTQTLQKAFADAKKRNKLISLRAYARFIGVSAGMLSELLREQRKASPKLALEIAAKAKFDEKSVQRLKNLMDPSRSSNVDRKVLSSQAIDLVMNPLYYRLMCALEILPSPSRVSDLANYLETSAANVTKLAKTLQEFDIVEMKGSKITWNGNYVATPQDLPSAKIQSFHRATLKEAVQDLSLPVNEREYTSVVFASNASRLENAKQQIRSFRDDFSESMRDPNPERIYQLSIQFRPVSKIHPGDDQ